MVPRRCLRWRRDRREAQGGEDDDNDDSDVEMTIDGPIPMSDAGIMDYETLGSLRNFKGDSPVRRIASFKENFDDTDKPSQK